VLSAVTKGLLDPSWAGDLGRSRVSRLANQHGLSGSLSIPAIKTQTLVTKVSAKFIKLRCVQRSMGHSNGKRFMQLGLDRAMKEAQRLVWFWFNC